MNYILFEDETRNRLLPFTHTRPASDIRCGIMTMRERWEKLLQACTSTLPLEPYLQAIYPQKDAEQSIYINASLFATADLTEACISLPVNTRLMQDGLLIAVHCQGTVKTFTSLKELDLDTREYANPLKRLYDPWDIFSFNEKAIADDFVLLTAGRVSEPLPEHVTAIGKEHIFLEKGAVVNPCIINASIGPVYIGEDAQVLEGCMMRGPIALGKHAVVKMGAKIYGGTTIGEGCKVGGEISNVVFFANSNKGHDGFLGNSVIGEWCNLGADTNCSNLKNNYDVVTVWQEHTGKGIKTGLQFCGLMMADHSKCGINTMFNTGTVVGVSCNIYGGGFPDKFIPSFSWGGSEGMTTYAFDKAMDTARRMMARRSIELNKEQEDMYRYIFDETSSQRGEKSNKTIN